MNELVRFGNYRSLLAEGPLWHEGNFYWVDIERQQILIADMQAVRIVRDAGFRVTALAPRAEGGFLMASERGIYTMDTIDGPLRPVLDPEADDPRTRLNDGKCDPQGRFWVGSMGFKAEPGIGSLYCLGTDATCRREVEQVTISNGLAWSVDGTTLYFIDSPTRTIKAFPFSGETGKLGEGRTVITIPESDGYPDGMTIDLLGRLWIALWEGSCIACYDPKTGIEADRIRLPVSRPTSCTFGGAEMDELIITTASFGLDEAALSAEPEAGSVFKIRMSVQGLPTAAFAAKIP